MLDNKKNGFNFLRKGWHLLGLVIPLSLYFDVFQDYFGLLNATRAILVTVLAISLVVLGILEILRFRYQGFSDIFWKIFGPLMKEGERATVNATVPYFIANLIVILFFPPELAVLSLAFLVIGDPFAAYIGSNYGRNRLYNGKSWEGIFAFLISSTLFGLILISFFQSEYGLSTGMFVVLVLGSLSAGVTEFFSGTTWKGFLDDNLLIPIVSCFVMAISAGIIMGVGWDKIFFPVSNLYL